MAGTAPSLFLGPRVAVAAERPPILIRVLIRRPDTSVDATSLTVTGDGEFAITDAANSLVVKAPARTVISVGRDGDGFWVEDPNGKRRANLAGPLRVNGTGDGAPLRNQSSSSGEPTAFRGTLEITSSPEGRVALVNVLGLEEYLYGVVTKELPASFGQEPLKAQAVAARTYALFRRRSAPHKAQSADVCDTSHCQVFYAIQGEVAAGRAAVDATKWEVLLRGGAVFEPVYSSACGGHTESAARVFGIGDDGDDGVADGEIPGGASLGSDAGALRFFKSTWDSNCSGSDKYRWSYSWEGDQIKDMVSAGIRRFEGTQTLTASSTDARIEEIQNVSVPDRGPSGRAMSIRFEAPGVAWMVKRDWGIRNFLRTPDGIILPSSAIALESQRSPDGKLEKLTVYGAGWGHGAGMCQWGTRGLAARGASYEEILDYYYPGIEVVEASA
jgi:stage II sporulation protein D